MQAEYINKSINSVEVVREDYWFCFTENAAATAADTDDPHEDESGSDC